MIIGTGDGGAHADRDDGAEWSTYYIRSWLLDRQLISLEEGIRRITHLPAMICGIKNRGLIARGYHADVMLFDPDRIRLGKKELVSDMPGGEPRWQVRPEGIARVLVNGETIVERWRADRGVVRVACCASATRSPESTSPRRRRDAEGVCRPSARARRRKQNEHSSRILCVSALKCWRGGGMKARCFTRRDRPVAIEEVEVRDPGPGEVRVAIKAAGLCHSDLSVIDGTIPYPTPVVLGHEGAGIVDAVGVGVRSVQEGDTVIISTLSHCGRCSKCDEGHPTECRNAPSPKDAKPFTVARQAGLPVRQRLGLRRAHGGARAGRHSDRPARAVRPRGADRLRRDDRLRRGGEPRPRRDRRDDGRVRRRRHRSQLRAGRRHGRRVEDHRRRRHAAEARVGAALRRHARHRQRQGRSGRGDQGPHRRRRRLHLRVRRQHRRDQAGARRARPGRRADDRRRAEGRHDVRVRRPRALSEQVDPRLPLRRRPPAARFPDARRPLSERAAEDRRADHAALRARRLRPRARTTCARGTWRAGVFAME